VIIVAKPSITPAELRDAIAAGRAPTILDVRSKREFAGDHVPGAINIPFHQVGARAGDVPSTPDDPLVVYCGHGPRAWVAARALRAHGFSNVMYLKGHWAAWKRSVAGGQ
jgi:rhodanese-related sulfurtransferase